jgi:glycine cleavage system H protein
MYNLKFTKTHEWIAYTEDGKAKVGITDFAQNELGELVFVNLPIVGDSVTAGESFTDVESVKAVAEIYSPLTGTICAVNEELDTNPALINEDPMNAWIVEIEDIKDTSDLLDEDEYEEFCKNA